MIIQKGQSLIETVVALGVAVIVVSAITMTVLTALNNSDYGKNQNQATQYAQQGLELVKQQSQSDWTTFSSLAPLGDVAHVYCLALNADTIGSDRPNPLTPSMCSVNVDTFIRQVTLQTPGGCDATIKATQAIADVYWTDSRCIDSSTYCHRVELNSCLSNSYLVPSP